MLRGMNEVMNNVDKWRDKKKIAIAAYAKMIVAPQMESYAKRNRSWNDISSDARKGLKGGVVMRGNKVIIYIAHTVDYGVYLELANDGNYAILDPTIEAMEDKVRQGYEKLMSMPW